MLNKDPIENKFKTTQKTTVIVKISLKWVKNSKPKTKSK